MLPTHGGLKEGHLRRHRILAATPMRRCRKSGGGRGARLPPFSNDNEPQNSGLKVKVAIPDDIPVTQVEIEVVAALLDSWSETPANDNEESS